ncbi:hypothetical protein ACV33M_32350, partial [Pseudomonas aeruginosa]
MLLNQRTEMRAAKVPELARELIELIDALKQRGVFAAMNEFNYLARTNMVTVAHHFAKFA